MKKKHFFLVIDVLMFFGSLRIVWMSLFLVVLIVPCAVVTYLELPLLRRLKGTRALLRPLIAPVAGIIVGSIISAIHSGPVTANTFCFWMTAPMSGFVASVIIISTRRQPKLRP